MLNKDKMENTELSWGNPDFKELKSLAINRLKWHPYEVKNTIEETEKKREKGWNFNCQKKINDYFNRQHKFAEYKSKRILKAIGRIKRKKQEKRLKSH